MYYLCSCIIVYYFHIYSCFPSYLFLVRFSCLICGCIIIHTRATHPAHLKLRMYCSKDYVKKEEGDFNRCCHNERALYLSETFPLRENARMQKYAGVVCVVIVDNIVWLHNINTTTAVV